MRAAILALAACGVPNVHFNGGDGGADGPSADAAPSGSFVWVRSLSAVGPLGVAAGAGGIVVTGYLSSSADLGGGTLTAVGGADQIIAGFTEADASHLYSVRHGIAMGQEYPWVDIVDSSDTPMIEGVAYGNPQYDLGKGPMMCGSPNAGSDGYIGRYSNGTPSWLNMLVGPGEDKILWSAPGPSDTVYAAGWFEQLAVGQTTSWNGGTLTSAGGRDLLLTRMNTFTGVIDLTKQYGGTGRDETSGIATHNGNVFLAGFFDDTFSFGGGTPAITAKGGGLDLFFAKLDATGNGIWAVAYGGPGDDRGAEIVVDANGDVYAAGQFHLTMTLGTNTLTSLGGSDCFVAKLSGVDGSVVWASSFGSMVDDFCGRIAVDGRGNLTFAGAVRGPLDGSATAGIGVGMITQYDTATGAIKWRKMIATPTDAGAGPVTYGTSGDLLVAISLGGAYDFGKPIIGAAAPRAVLARMVP
jgi:hypothetical protein